MLIVREAGEAVNGFMGILYFLPHFSVNLKLLKKKSINFKKYVTLLSLWKIFFLT